MQLFENDQVMVVHKQPGWLSVPSRWGQKDERPVLGTWLQQQKQKQIFPVHRLDEEVSGLMIFAFRPEAHRLLNSAFENKEIKKVYQAISEAAKAPPDSAQLQSWKSKLLRGKKRTYESPVGKDSVTEAIYLGEDKDRNLRWQLSPITGRSHQLRYELMKRGYPILGDTLYGAKNMFSGEGIALRCTEIHLPEDLAKKLQISTPLLATQPLF